MRPIASQSDLAAALRSGWHLIVVDGTPCLMRAGKSGGRATGARLAEVRYVHRHTFSAARDHGVITLHGWTGDAAEWRLNGKGVVTAT